MNRVSEGVPDSEVGRRAKVIRDEMKVRFSRQVQTAEQAIYYQQLYPDSESTRFVFNLIANLAQTSKDEAELHLISKYLSGIDELPGISRIEIERLLRDMAARDVEKFTNFSFVRELDTKYGYERYLELVPTGAGAYEARKRLVDLEVDEIMKGKVGELPELQPLASSRSSTRANIEIDNDTSYTLTVRYSGGDSKKFVLPPKTQKSFSLEKGTYRVTATVDAGSVIPYAGTEAIDYDSYGVTFYITSSPFSVPVPSLRR